MSDFFSALAGQKVAFIGAGVSHKELIPLFARAGAAVTLCDQKEADAFGGYVRELAALGVRLSLGANYLDGLGGQEMILRTPGFAFYTPELQAAARGGARLTSETDLFFEHCPCPITAVTGSDGKTTTTSLVAAIHRAAGYTVHLGGNIGRALLPIVDTVKETDIAVVELSSFQLISMRRSPHIAVVTNVTPNHLDHHKNMREYVDAKRNILLWQAGGDVAVLGYENEQSRGMQRDARGKTRFFSRLRPVPDGAYMDREGILRLAKNGEAVALVHKDEVKLRGEHNLENLLAAFAATGDLVAEDILRQVAKSFAGVEHRIEPVRTLGDVEWFNDSIASSPTRVIAGLRAFHQKIILLAGGYDKNLDYAPMAGDVLQRVKLLILMGPTAAKIEAAVRAEPGYSEEAPRILHAKNMAEAVALAHQNAVPGDVVSLSPASASFDAYENFEARGRHFKELVMAL